MDIRYYPTIWANSKDYYAVDYDSETIYYFDEIGTFFILYDRGEFFVGTTGRKEIAPPDTGPIEDRYLDSTDRPSVDGFKYPDVVEPWGR